MKGQSTSEGGDISKYKPELVFPFPFSAIVEGQIVGLLFGVVISWL